MCTTSLWVSHQKHEVWHSPERGYCEPPLDPREPPREKSVLSQLCVFFLPVIDVYVHGQSSRFGNKEARRQWRGVQERKAQVRTADWAVRTQTAAGGGGRSLAAQCRTEAGWRGPVRARCAERLPALPGARGGVASGAGRPAARAQAKQLNLALT